jgi:hypothetical protein
VIFSERSSVIGSISFYCFGLLVSRFETEDITQRVSQLFHGHPVLIQGFNTLMPTGYQIEGLSNPQDRGLITGTKTQSEVGRASGSLSARRDIGYGAYRISGFNAD